MDQNTETETVNNTDTDTEVDYSNLSDDEFLKFYDSKINHSTTSNNEETKNNVDTNQNLDNSTEDNNTKDKVEDIKEDTTNSTNEEKEDYEIEYDKVKNIFKDGFKANGKILKPKNMDEVISLMQMGANFNKKMKDIKHMTKQVKSLTEAGIEDLDTLNYVIDIYKGNQEAIKKLLKDKNISTYDLDLDDINYNKNYDNILSDENIEYRNTIDSIKESPNAEQIYNIVENIWDSKSKKEILNDSKVLEGLKYEVETGRYDIIQSEVDRLRSFGKLQNLDDLTAYRLVLHDYLEQNGIIDKQGNEIKTKPTNKIVTKDIDVNKESTKPTTHVNNTKNDKYSINDIVNMSDEEFIKEYNKGSFFTR